MKRIYFLVPDIEATKKIVDDLLLARIEEQHIHVIAKYGTPLEDLPEANLLQKSDFIPATEQGIAMGGAIGTLAGLVAVALPPASTVVAGGVLLGAGLAGAGVGGWLSGMVGMNVHNRQLKKFEGAIEAGEFLVLADIDSDRVDEIKERINTHIPEVELEMTEPRVPSFP